MSNVYFICVKSLSDEQEFTFVVQCVTGKSLGRFYNNLQNIIPLTDCGNNQTSLNPAFCKIF